MAWDFETEPEFQMHLEWMDQFLRDEVEPLDRTATEVMPEGECVEGVSGSRVNGRYLQRLVH